MHALFRLIRPRTLPLALAAVCCGNALAWHSSPTSWRGSVFLLSLLTALALQIVSNIANDYGDGIRGTDRHRAPDAPERLTASGQIPLPYIRRLLAASVLAALLLGSTLIALSLRHPQQWLAFLLLGSLALAAALTYTLGRHAYGYHGLGEISVFLFFGLLGVQGSAYLQQGSCPPEGWLPAAGCGLLCRWPPPTCIACKPPPAPPPPGANCRISCALLWPSTYFSAAACCSIPYYLNPFKLKENHIIIRS